ncbi:HNH endonuclease [Streptomyces sp. WAC06128]|uniref:HNH endonuclease n=1 Tax=Streptomyces sp. WAC06128 TaxID=2487426 RepID=UPI000FB88048|nr:HNH endonuclease signature motif containing protein [Streptomyces sp. WAC06128]RSS77805.1 HNH endonuclease [Streptomyces sp. WAC06128]
MTTAWLVLAVGDDRQHGGNDGYDDDPSQHYSWDDTVPNHGRIAVGDVIVLWDKKKLLGLGVISEIETGRETKTLYFCPECKRADFKRRKRLTPACRCNQCGTLFDVPGSKTREVVTYRSRHGEAWMDGRGLLTGRELRALCDSPDSQLSMRPARWEKLRDAIIDVAGISLDDLELDDEGAAGARRPIAGGHRMKNVRTRVGQAPFRKQLLLDYGQVCAFTGPAPAGALQAAHLYSYADEEEHHDWGGLLLRNDVHSLFDRGQITVNPDTGRIEVDDELLGYPAYAELHGRKPMVSLRPEHEVWLAAHWRTHRSAAVSVPASRRAGAASQRCETA